MRKLFQGQNLFITLGVLFLLVVSALFIRVPMPSISLPAEQISDWNIAGFPITNTLIATLLADVTVLVLAWVSPRRMKDVPPGFQNLVEWFFEAFDGLLVVIAVKFNELGIAPA